MNTSKYDAPQNTEYYIGHFTAKGDKRLKKSLREWMLYPKERKLFVNVALLNEEGLLCMYCDGISRIKYLDKKSPTFINSQWIIDEKIGGSEFYNEIKRLQQEVLDTLDEGRLVFSDNMKEYK
jgi:hypothetical protein